MIKVIHFMVLVIYGLSAQSICSDSSHIKEIDPKVVMKDSGAGWIGEIPKNWEIRRLKYYK